MDSTKGAMRLALSDAAKACIEDGAIASVVLNSGYEVIGRIQNKELIGNGILNMSVDRGWTTIDTDEIAAVGVQPTR